MKSVLIMIIGAFLLVGCASSNRTWKVPDENLININEEEEQYEIIILDPGFESWFLTTWSLAKDRSVEYYSLWNQRYVAEWNYKATRPHTSKYFDNTIQYDPNIDYGIDVERKLYYYFRWVDTKLGIPILSSPPPGGVL